MPRGQDWGQGGPMPDIWEGGWGLCTVRSIASWVMVTWGPPPVNRQTRVKTLPSHNFVGRRQYLTVYSYFQCFARTSVAVLVSCSFCRAADISSWNLKLIQAISTGELTQFKESVLILQELRTLGQGILGIPARKLTNLFKGFLFI